MWAWCYPHPLELACKNALSSKLFKDIDEMLLWLYLVYLYEITEEDSRAGRDCGRCEGSIWASQKQQCPCLVSGLKVDKPQMQGL